MPNELTEPVVMDCGHATTSTQRAPWLGPNGSRPICNDCWPLTSSVTLLLPDRPELHERTARCSCGATSASDQRLPFFEYTGEGSRLATETCKHCRFHQAAHTRRDSSSWHRRTICDQFEPYGPLDHDRYYCGCRGFE